MGRSRRFRESVVRLGGPTGSSGRGGTRSTGQWSKRDGPFHDTSVRDSYSVPGETPGAKTEGGVVSLEVQHPLVDHPHWCYGSEEVRPVSCGCPWRVVCPGVEQEVEVRLVAEDVEEDRGVEGDVGKVEKDLVGQPERVEGPSRCFSASLSVCGIPIPVLGPSGRGCPRRVTRGTRVWV